MGLIGIFETIAFWTLAIKLWGYLTDDGVKEPPSEWGLEPKGSDLRNAYEAYHNKPGLFSRFLDSMSKQSPMPHYEYKQVENISWRPQIHTSAYHAKYN